MHNVRKLYLIPHLSNFHFTAARKSWPAFWTGMWFGKKRITHTHPNTLHGTTAFERYSSDFVIS